MTPASGPDRRRSLADRLLAHRQEVAEHVTDDFLDRHPDWRRRYGDLARLRGVEDALFHVDFLAGAIRGGRVEAFEHYARWTAGVLSSRGIDPRYLVENLEEVGRHLATGLEADDAAVVSGFVERGCTAILERPPVAEREEALEGEQSLFLQAILGGHRQAAANIALEAVGGGRSVTDVYCDVLEPAQYEVGRLWERNEITVAREHMATAVTQYVAGRLYSMLEIPSAKRGNAVVTGVEGELHQLGANMMADVLEAAGWNVRFLGTQSPHRDILRAMDEHEPVLLGVSTTMLFNVPGVEHLLLEARKRFGDELMTVVGGGAFRTVPHVWKEIGADAFGRDLREGLAAVDRLVRPEAE